MASDNIPIDDQAMEELRRKSMEIECHNQMLIDENRKRGIKCEDLQKEKSELERKISFLEGQIEAYRYVLRCRRYL